MLKSKYIYFNDLYIGTIIVKDDEDYSDLFWATISEYMYSVVKHLLPDTIFSIGLTSKQLYLYYRKEFYKLTGLSDVIIIKNLKSSGNKIIVFIKK